MQEVQTQTQTTKIVPGEKDDIVAKALAAFTRILINHQFSGSIFDACATIAAISEFTEDPDLTLQLPNIGVPRDVAYTMVLQFQIVDKLCTMLDIPSAKEAFRVIDRSTEDLSAMNDKLGDDLRSLAEMVSAKNIVTSNSEEE